MRCVLGFDIYYYRVMHAQTKFCTTVLSDTDELNMQ